MSFLDQYIVPFKGYKVGIHQMQMPLGKELLEAMGDEEMVDAQAVANITLTRAANMLTFEIEISGQVTVECDRCLDDLLLPVEISDTLYVKFSEEEIEFDGEVMWLNPTDSQIDLSTYLYETLLLALPYQRVHENIEDCNPEMVERFKIVTEEEFNLLTEPQSSTLAAGQGADALEALKRQMTEEE